MHLNHRNHILLDLRQLGTHVAINPAKGSRSLDGDHKRAAPVHNPKVLELQRSLGSVNIERGRRRVWNKLEHLQWSWNAEGHFMHRMRGDFPVSTLSHTAHTCHRHTCFVHKKSSPSLIELGKFFRVSQNRMSALQKTEELRESGFIAPLSRSWDSRGRSRNDRTGIADTAEARHGVP